MSEFHEVFGQLPIIGMLHLSGRDKVERVLQELEIYEQSGLAGAIVENYHGSALDVEKALREIADRGTSLVIGVNILPNEYEASFEMAQEYGAKFIQLDHVAGRYNEGTINALSFLEAGQAHPDILVLGGVWPKYYHPKPGSDLEADLSEGVLRSDAIVVTGAGTGHETPLEKIMRFRNAIGSHPLIIGAGLNSLNAYQQLSMADGAIVGSYFKPDGDTSKQVISAKVQEIQNIASAARAFKTNTEKSSRI